MKYGLQYPITKILSALLQSCIKLIIFLFIRNGQWKVGSYEGIILTCGDRVTRNVHMVTHKPTHPVARANKMQLNDAKTCAEPGHGFLSVTFTRALTKNVRKKLKMMSSSGTDALLDFERPVDGDSVYLSEVCVSVQPCDAIFNGPVMATLFNIFTLPSNHQVHNPQMKQQIPNDSFNTGYTAASSSHLPFVSSKNLPLVHLNASNFRLFLPTISTGSVWHEGLSDDDRNESRPTWRMGKLDHDVCLLQVSSLQLVPQADNPLPRLVVDRDVYRRAVQAGITSQPGSEVEDRQYQLDIGGLSLGSGTWSDLVSRSGLTSQLSDGTAFQNPALEWNTLPRSRYITKLISCTNYKYLNPAVFAREKSYSIQLNAKK